MENLTQIISGFDTISLSQMDGVKLMNRTDTKFTFSCLKLNELLKNIKPFYNILDIKGQLIQDYKSLYYDTVDRKFYIDHHNRRVNRNKIRFRQYVGSDLTFLEIKLKNNKGRTIKKRIKVLDGIPNKISKEQSTFIKKIIGKNIDVSAQQWISFRRITLVSKKDKERLTIDIDLNFSNEIKTGNLNYLAIAEVKQERMSRSSIFITKAKEMGILPFRLSKYCISTLQLNPDIKKNRFKKKELFINKLKYA